ncbi:MAG: glycosyltransferase family 4 protein [Candidatus Omnitrophica bacterium]|jgi:glycosyltransferase involved in cell wall biosynthesis|nr:glycosyltransferase family 4 protein [Candidatus Omnitrophota bacterium]
MKNVAIINSGSFVYGAERGLINLIRALSNRFNITVFLPHKGYLTDKLKSDFPAVKIKIFPFPVLMLSYSPLYYFYFFISSALSIIYLIFYVIRNRVDIICSNSLLLIFPGLVAKLTKRRHIWHIREFFFLRLINKILGMLARELSDTIVCQSKSIREKLNLFGKAKVVYEPLYPDDYKIYDSVLLKKEFQLPLDSKIITFVSRIHPLKGQYEFLRELKPVLKKSGKLFLLIAGDISPPTFRNRWYKRKIFRFINKNNLKNVRLLGFRKDIDKIFSLSDICVFPFLREEPFGIAVTESLAFGKTTFFNQKGGLKEIFDIFKAGDEYDIDKLKEKLSQINSQTIEIKRFYIPRDLSFRNYENEIAHLYF